MVHEGEGVAFEVEEDPPRSVTPEEKQDPEEDEDPVWQEFSQEYYEGSFLRFFRPNGVMPDREEDSGGTAPA